MRLLGLLALASLGCGAGEPLLDAIRNGDMGQMRAALEAGGKPDTRDANGATALMYCALYSTADCTETLLKAGADPNAANAAGATALMWAVHDPAQVRLLLAAGANPNARSAEGRTPLLIAARQDGAGEVVRMLLAKGADPKAKDNFGGTALMLAAQAGDAELARMFIELGCDVNAQAAVPYGLPRFGRAAGLKVPPGAGGVTALILAAANQHPDVVKLLLDRGADPKIKALGIAEALHAAAWQSDPGMARMLIAKGADVNTRDMRGATLVEIARASDDATPDMIELLRHHGAPQLEAAPRVESVKAVMAKPPADARAAVAKSLSLLQTSGSTFLKNSACFSCHHNSIPTLAVAAARQRGFKVDEQLAREQVKMTTAILALHREQSLQGIASLPATTLVVSYQLIALAAEKYPADLATDALVHELAARQSCDGRWRMPRSIDGVRPPLDQGDITSTALTIRAIQLYNLPGRRQEMARRIERARDWLAAETPRTPQERNMRLLGLAWADAGPGTVRAAADEILFNQREDGGWAQMPKLESDAYATGQALFALREARAVETSAPAYRRGVKFLLSTQGEAGDWHVKSRAIGFQPYFETGYPHGKDQFVSAAGGGWATLALALGEER